MTNKDKPRMYSISKAFHDKYVKNATPPTWKEHLKTLRRKEHDPPPKKGSLGALGFSHRATIRKARIGELFRYRVSTQFPLENKLEAPPCASLRPEPSRRRPLEGPPRGQGRRETGRP